MLLSHQTTRSDMDTTRTKKSGNRWSLAGLGVGLLAGLGLFAGYVGGAASGGDDAAAAGLVDVLHTPPLLVEPGEAVRLRYDAVCAADSQGAPCPVEGNVFLRSGPDGPFERVPLTSGDESTLTATLPPRFGEDASISYYAVIEDGLGRDRTTIPEAGSAAPQRAWITPAVTAVELGGHVFGRTREPDGRLVHGPWGSESGAFGLIAGRGSRIGPSSFDVAPDGTLVVLDQVNRRLVFARRGGDARYAPIRFGKTEGDLAVDGQGNVFVLEHGASPEFHGYTPTGVPAGEVTVSSRGADMVRAGDRGVFVHGYPDAWVPVSEEGDLLDPGRQAEGARSGLRAGGGVEVVVHGSHGEAMFALVRDDRVLKSWRVSSASSLGEIQLAEPFGDGLLVVLRVWTEAQAEFVALVLSRTGLAQSFSMAAGEWAESAPLSRFRLDGSTLYQLRSAPDGFEIVTFDLGGAK
jgi:hypothetical protein